MLCTPLDGVLYSPAQDHYQLLLLLSSQYYTSQSLGYLWVSPLPVVVVRGADLVQLLHRIVIEDSGLGCGRVAPTPFRSRVVTVS